VPELAPPSLTDAVNAYEQQGADAFRSELEDISAIQHSSTYLFDRDSKVLLGEGTPPALYQRIVAGVLQAQRSVLLRFGRRVLFASPMQSATGRRYVAILTVFEPHPRALKMRFWFNLAIALVRAALVCLLLSLYLTRPITRLRATAQRLASGDFGARAAPTGIVRKDELGDLARDFDAMAAQIQLLITAQRRFVADVSHELGARRQCGEKSSAELARIERETGKLSSLVQQLLLLAGLEAGACPAETLAPVSMRSLCESIIEDANFEAAHAGCKVTGSRQDVSFLAYPNLLRRAIDKVLRNAIHDAPAGTEIRLDCRTADNLRDVVLEVLDCGPGVPESMLSDIFRPFFRTAPGRERGSGGTGLGLAIASEAVRLHDGSSTAQNRKSGGLQLTISVPFRIPTRGRPAAHRERSLNVETGTATHGRRELPGE
jgi:two-component system, OmpR family, sensor histidine kinase CpxA